MVLPASMRLKGHKCFDHLHRAGIHFQGPSMVLKVVKARPQLVKTQQQFKPQSIRLAIAISNKVSKRAVIRNRLRRLLHDHLKKRLSKTTEHANLWALLSLKPSSLNKEATPLLEECDRLLCNAGLVS